jgi:hypothetical protein
MVARGSVDRRFEITHSADPQQQLSVYDLGNEDINDFARSAD